MVPRDGIGPPTRGFSVLCPSVAVVQGKGRERRGPTDGDVTTRFRERRRHERTIMNSGCPRVNIPSSRIDIPRGSTVLSHDPRSRKNLKRSYVFRPDNGEVPSVERRDARKAESFGKRHDGCVDRPEGQIAISGDQLRDPYPIARENRCCSEVSR